jgi:hypothetical protein
MFNFEKNRSVYFKSFYIQFCFIIILGVNFKLASQTFSISGNIVDSTGKLPLYGASINLKPLGDTLSKLNFGATTDTLGHFTISNVNIGNYRLKTAAIGYKPSVQRIAVTNSNIDLATISISKSGIVLKDVIIDEKQTRMEQNGDTTAFNAGAYKTNPDATSEDLINKLPGITNQNGVIKVNGEEVKQVLVNGKAYFGDDVNAGLKNLQADMVNKVQVYDQASEQSQFTGFDDGQAKKTINLVTKNKNMNGQFGKVYAGYGTDERYTTGITLNNFDKARRLTFLGLSNNINLQNFSMSDIFGSAGGGKTWSRGGSNNFNRGGSGNNFSVGQLGGVTQTNSIGINYSDEWGKKIKVSGSYFLNESNNLNTNDLLRNYYLNFERFSYYKETNDESNKNINNRFNFRLEYTIDSLNAIVITTKLTSQFIVYDKILEGGNYSSLNEIQTSIFTTNGTKNLGYNYSNGITYRHRFQKMGRSLSLDLNGTNNPRNGNAAYFSSNKFRSDTTLIDQNSFFKSKTYAATTSIAWTEPVGQFGQFLFNYAPTITWNSLDKETDNFDFNTYDYTKIDTGLTNKYENKYYTHKVGIKYRFKKTMWSILIGNDFQYAILKGNEMFPSSVQIKKPFQNILPNTIFNYKFKDGKNLKMIYRTATVAPTISQLQKVIDNTNPLQLKTGNPELLQNYEQTFIVHYRKTNAKKATGFFAFFYLGITNNYIANSTTIANRDTLLNDVFLNQGSQLSNYVNLNGYKNGRGFLTYSIPLSKIKCNLSFNGSCNYSLIPALINGLTNNSQNIKLGPGSTLSSNISKKVDFTISYNGSYNIISNSIQLQADDNYFTHTASLKINYLPFKGIIINSSIDQTFYAGLNQAYNTNFFLWNASIGYKFLKNKSLETKVSVFDILNQNTSINRAVTETYIEDSKTNVLKQYFMFTLTYNIKKLKSQGSQGRGGPRGGGGNTGGPRRPTR